MSGMDDRRQAFENKYAHDEEFQFKVTARRNKLLGLWAAALLGKENAEAEAYSKEVVLADFEKPGDEDVLEKVFTDLKHAGLSVTSDELRQKIEECAKDAKDALMNEGDQS